MAGYWGTKEAVEARLISHLAASAIETFCCGIQFFMVAQGFAVYYRSPKDRKKTKRLYMIISFLILALSLVTMITNVMKLGQYLMRSSDLMDYEHAKHSKTLPWWFILSQCTWMLIFVTADAVLLWRCYLIWQNILIVILPALTFTASIVIGSLCIVTEVIPRTHPFRLKYAIPFQTAWAFISVSTGLIITALIALRLVKAKRELSLIMNESEAHAYTGIIVIVLESAAPFAIIGIIVASVSMAEPNRDIVRAQGILWNLWLLAGSLSPQLIIYRVNLGKSWTHTLTSEDLKLTKSIRFADPDNALEKKSVDARFPSATSRSSYSSSS